MQILDAKTGQVLLVLRQGNWPIVVVAWSHDGRRIAAADNRGQVTIREVPEAR